MHSVPRAPMRNFTQILPGIPIVVAAAGLCGSVSCSSEPESHVAAGGSFQSGGAAQNGSSQSGSSHSSRGGSATGGVPDLAVSMAGDAAGGDTASAVCDAQVREGQRVPIDMYFLVDSSGSMNDTVSGGTKWEVVSSALVGFLEDPRSADTGVGIGYFPVDSTSCSKGQPGCFCI